MIAEPCAHWLVSAESREFDLLAKAKDIDGLATHIRRADPVDVNGAEVDSVLMGDLMDVLLCLGIKWRHDCFPKVADPLPLGPPN